MLIDFRFLDCLIEILIKNKSKSIRFYLKFNKFNCKMDQNPVKLIKKRSKMTQNCNQRYYFDAGF